VCSEARFDAVTGSGSSVLCCEGDTIGASYSMTCAQDQNCTPGEPGLPPAEPGPEPNPAEGQPAAGNVSSITAEQDINVMDDVHLCAPYNLVCVVFCADLADDLACYRKWTKIITIGAIGALLFLCACYCCYRSTCSSGTGLAYSSLEAEKEEEAELAAKAHDASETESLAGGVQRDAELGGGQPQPQPQPQPPPKGLSLSPMPAERSPGDRATDEANAMNVQLQAKQKSLLDKQEEAQRLISAAQQDRKDAQAKRAASSEEQGGATAATAVAQAPLQKTLVKTYTKEQQDRLGVDAFGRGLDGFFTRKEVMDVESPHGGEQLGVLTPSPKTEVSPKVSPDSSTSHPQPHHN